jgi:two-component system OmpR family response regulator
MSRYRILYVDDEPDMREIALLSLGLDRSFEARACASGSEALSVLATWRPDLIMLDVVMPDMDGPQTLSRLRDEPSTRAIPVVFITARAHHDAADGFIRLGAAGIVPKPFNPMTLAKTVRQYLPPAEPEPLA